MKKQKEIRRIFLYDEDTRISEDYEHAYKHIKAISEDEQHYFEFVVNQDDYGQSLKELCEKFEDFCVNECGFDDCLYCEVWTTFYHRCNYVHTDEYQGELYEETLDCLLCSCDWATICSMETTYCFSCSHLRLPNSKYDRPPTFEEFASANGYDESKEPYATKELFYIFDSKVNKKQFSNDELKLIESFVKKNIYLSGWKKWTYFTTGLSDFLSERLNINIFDKEYRNQENITARYIMNTLNTLAVAIIRLFDNDKKSLKKILKRYDTQVKQYVKKIIKRRSWYED